MAKKSKNRNQSDAKAFLDQTAKGGEESGDVSESESAEAEADSAADESQPQDETPAEAEVKPAKVEKAEASVNPDKYAGLPRKMHKFV